MLFDFSHFHFVLLLMMKLADSRVTSAKWDTGQAERPESTMAWRVAQAPAESKSAV